MPIYDYLCSACDHRLDILHGINDPGPGFCPSCGAAGTMRKQFGVPTVHFKGSGWAKKDRGGSSRTRAAAASGSGDASAAKGGDPVTPAADGGQSGSSSTSGSDSSSGSSGSSSTSGSDSSSDSSGRSSDKVD
jgi:putative FmdB family regulatory protein